MKKVLKSIACLCMALLIPFALVACGKDNNKDSITRVSKPVITEVSTNEALKTALSSTCDEIKLTSDITIDDTLVVTRKVTFNLNGKTINNTEDIWVDTETEDKWSLISVGANGDLTITGNGKLKAKENDCYAVDVVDGGKLTIENGEFIGNISAVYVFEGEALIKGGKFSIQQLSSQSDERFTLNLYDAHRTNGTAKIKVNGGEFNKFNPANNLAEGENTNFVVDGYKSVLVDGSTTDYKVIAE